MARDDARRRKGGKRNRHGAGNKAGGGSSGSGRGRTILLVVGAIAVVVAAISMSAPGGSSTGSGEQGRRTQGVEVARVARMGRDAGPRVPPVDTTSAADIVRATGAAVIPVQRRVWSPSKEFAAEAIDGGVPVVFENTAATTWPALRKWTSLGYLAGHAQDGMMHRVYARPVRSFPYFHDRPMSQLPFIDWSELSFDIWPEMDASEFERSVADGNQSPWYLYYSNQLSADFGKVAGDVSAREFFQAPQAAAEEVKVMLWMGVPHVVTHTHNDAMHNFFVQVLGRKRFVLWAPDEVANLYAFPDIHPQHQQSQVVLTDAGAVDLDRFPAFVNATAYEVTVNPGDVLYIPPYWYHHVESLDDVISVNIWSPTGEKEAFTDAFAKISFVDAGCVSKDFPLASAFWFSAELVKGAFRGDPTHAALSPLEFFETYLWDSRFRPIYEQYAELRFAPGTFCPEVAYSRRFVPGDACQPALDAALDLYSEQEWAIRLMRMVTFVEYLLVWAVGTENVPYVLAELVSCSAGNDGWAR